MVKLDWPDWWSWIKKHDIALFYWVSFTIFLFLQSTNTLADPDSFYHTRLSTYLRDFGLIRDFPWTQVSLYKEYFIDHHFGYHLILLPFVSIFPELVGLKLATAFLAAGSVTVVVWVLKKWQVSHYWIGAVLLLSAPAFLFRLSLGKAPSIGVGVAIFGYYLITNRQYWWIFLWSLFFTWLYSAWPLLLVMSLIYIFSEGVYNNFGNWRQVWRSWFVKENYLLIVAIIGGYLLGLLFNPYFPINIIYLKQLFAMSLVSYSSFLGIGAEWYPYNISDLIPNISLILIFWLVAILVSVFHFKKIKQLSWTTCLLTVVMFLYTLKARRQIEYLTPIMVLSAGLLWRDLSCLWQEYNIKKELVSWTPIWLRNGLIKKIVFGYLILAIGFSLGFGLYKTKYSLDHGIKVNELKGASEWLKQNTPSRSLVWQTDWGSFPLVWFYNQRNYYLTGLDQTFMYEYNNGLYWQWVGINKGLRKDVYYVTKEVFKTDYVLLQKKYSSMLPWVNRDKRFEKNYEDQESIIYKIN